MAYDTTEAVAKFLSGFQMERTSLKSRPTLGRISTISQVAQTLAS